MNTRLLRLLRGRRGFLKLLRERPILGVVGSLAVHALIAAALIFFRAPEVTYVGQRGEPLFLELPPAEERALRGLPPIRDDGAESAAAAMPQAVSRPQPAPQVEARRAPQPPAPAPRRAPEPPRQPAPAPRVASPPAASPPEPAPRVTEPPSPSDQSTVAAAAPPVDTPTAAASSSPPSVPADAPAAAPTPPASGAESQVASVPSGVAPGARTVPDFRSAFRRGGGSGGAGGTGAAREGIEGEPVPLDSRDPRYSDYLDRVRRMIKAKWSYPCVKNTFTSECEYKSAQLIIEFGIAKNGHVPFVTLRDQSGYPIYDEYALNAIKLASPFPPIPDSVSRKGIPILARFNYVLETTSLTNVLR